MGNHLLYQAYGQKAISHECLLSIYSLMDLYDDVMNFDITVYTDDPAYLKNRLPEQVQLLFLSEEKIRTWQGKDRFVHRVKVKVIEDFLTRFPGNLIYADTDTFFLKKIEPLFQRIQNGEFLMHELEGTIGEETNLLLRNIRRHFEKPSIKKQFYLPPETTMYNAGLIGLGSRDLNVVKKVEKTTDQLYKLQPKGVMEQLAFNIHLNRAGRIFPASDYLLHYWRIKPDFRVVLNQFFKAHDQLSVSEIVKKIKSVDPGPFLRAKERSDRLPLWERTLRKLTGKSWGSRI